MKVTCHLKVRDVGEAAVTWHAQSFVYVKEMKNVSMHILDKPTWMTMMMMMMMMMMTKPLLN